MKALAWVGLISVASVCLLVIFVFSGGFAGMLRLAIGVLVLPVLVLLLMPKFWLGWFSHDLLDLSIRRRRGR